MAQLNRTDFKTKVDANITTNGAEAITGAIDNEIRNDQADSFLNLVSDSFLLNLRDYNPSRTYEVGEGCFESSTLYRCTANTGGSFDIADWEEVSGGGGTTSPLTTKGDLYTFDGATDERLPVGTNGQVLKANSATSTGLEWGDLTAANTGYTPADNDNWLTPVPTTTKEALDRLSQQHDFTNVAFVDANYIGVSEIGNINRPFTDITDATTAGSAGMKIFCLSDCGGTILVTDAHIYANGHTLNLSNLGVSSNNATVYDGVNMTFSILGSPLINFNNCEITSYSKISGTLFGVFKNCRVILSNQIEVFQAFNTAFDCPLTFQNNGTNPIEIVGNEFFSYSIIPDRTGGIIANNQWFTKDATLGCLRWSAGFNTSQRWGTLKVFGNTFDTWDGTAPTNEAILEITNSFTASMTMSAYGNYYRNTVFSTLTNNTITETNNLQIL